jgi:hypothetical protein
LMATVPVPARPWRRRLVGLSLAAAAAVAVVGVREARRGEGGPGRTAQITTTTSGSRIAIAGAALEIAPESAVSFGGGKDGAMVVVLDRGAVTCEVTPRTNRAPFIVEAGATRVTVIGTRFTVRRVGGHASVSVEHGLVEVADTNMTELVHAGERFQPGEPVALEPLATEAVAPPVAAPPVAAAKASAPAAVVAAVASPSRTPAHRAHERRVAVASPAEPAAPPAPAERESAPRVEETPAAPAPTAAALEVAKAEKPAAGVPERAGPQRGSTQVLFELAAQLEVRDPTTALSIYGQIAAGDDPWAASALFASARLEAERNRTRGARELSQTYLRRFPLGPNADDARALLDTLR